MRLRDKVAIVTGSGSGFGRMTAARFAEEGARIVIADVDEAGAEETGAIVTRTGGEAELVIGDISTLKGARAVVERTVERFGTVDILVNNAGISQRDSWARVVRPGLERAKHGRRHRVLVVAHGCAPRVSEPAQRREQHGAGRRRERPHRT